MMDLDLLRRSLFSLGNKIKTLAQHNAQQVSENKLGAWTRRSTGQLARSIEFTIDGNDKELSLSLGSDGVIYARVQEFGTVGAGGVLPDIVPKRAKYLTIPFGPQYQFKRARDFGDSLFKPEGKNVLLNKDANNEVAFLLARQARIPPKAYIGKAIETIDKKMDLIIEQTFESVIRSEIDARS